MNSAQAEFDICRQYTLQFSRKLSFAKLRFTTTKPGSKTSGISYMGSFCVIPCDHIHVELRFLTKKNYQQVFDAASVLSFLKRHNVLLASFIDHALPPIISSTEVSSEPQPDKTTG